MIEREMFKKRRKKGKKNKSKKRESKQGYIQEESNQGIKELTSSNKKSKEREEDKQRKRSATRACYSILRLLARR